MDVALLCDVYVVNEVDDDDDDASRLKIATLLLAGGGVICGAGTADG